ncbi:MAG TPA: hypothetical protein VMX14_13190 [Anaerolineae bacterium]|nr:hypothetical protein [Anaerolineae bacterium]
MTIEQAIKNWLCSQGMSNSQAAAVIEMMKADEDNKSMQNRWDTMVEDYTDIVMIILLDSAKQTALEYIDANCPRAFFRSLFAE